MDNDNTSTRLDSTFRSVLSVTGYPWTDRDCSDEHEVSHILRVLLQTAEAKAALIGAAADSDVLPDGTIYRASLDLETDIRNARAVLDLWDKSKRAMRLG